MKLSPSLLLLLASLVPRRAAAVDAEPFLAAVRAERAAARAVSRRPPLRPRVLVLAWQLTPTRPPVPLGRRQDHYQSFATQENEKCFAPGCELRTGTYDDPYGDELAW